MSMFPLPMKQLNIKNVRNVSIMAKEREIWLWVKFTLFFQKILHSQGVCKAAEQRPLRQDLHHAVLQLRHEERSGPAFGSTLFTWSKGSPSSVNTCHWMFLISILSAYPVWLHQTRIGLSLYDVAGQGYLRESVSFSYKNNKCFSSRYIQVFPTIGKWWFSVEVTLKTLWHSLSCVGSGELHPGADPHSASAGRAGEVLLLFLRLHRCSQVLLLPGPPPNR